MQVSILPELLLFLGQGQAAEEENPNHEDSHIPEKILLTHFALLSPEWLKVDDKAGSFSLFLRMARLDSNKVSIPCQENKAKLKLHPSHTTWKHPQRITHHPLSPPPLREPEKDPLSARTWAGNKKIDL